tara:strand:- start:154 stop:369 length:216 start_codon:yes stop_codon:yes gene_type:complete
MNSFANLQKWLDKAGYKLGYDIHNIPEPKYWHLIERLGIYAHTWYGYNEQEQYDWYENDNYRDFLNKYEGS